MRQGVFDQRHANEVLLGRFNSFFDRQRNFTRFAGAKTYMAAFVTDDDERGERKVLAALDYFGDAIDRDHLVFQIQALRPNSLPRLSHFFFFLLLFSGCSAGAGSAFSSAATASSRLSPAARAASVRARTRPW